MLMIVTWLEILDFAIMAVVVGYIFSDFFRKDFRSVFDTKAILFAAGITAPAIVLHELAHKFVAMSMGLTATFHAAYGWLMVGIILKALNTGFIFFVPAYVSITGLSTPLTQAKVAVAGPLTNLVLFLVCWAVLKLNLIKGKRAVVFTVISKKINGFLFIFNMIPIPGFDGFQFFSGMIKTYFMH